MLLAKAISQFNALALSREQGSAKDRQIKQLAN
jgi:hypothetical protein